MTLAAYYTRPASREHFVIVNGEKIPASLLALTVGPGWNTLKHEEEFDCLECGKKCSAKHLYSESDVPGECIDCADEFFCPHGMHPDDTCDECEESLVTGA